MKDFFRKFSWILFEISWPLGFGILLFYGGFYSGWIFKDSKVFLCVWISVQALSMIVPFVLSVFDKIRSLSVLVGALWGGGVYACILYWFMMAGIEALSPLTKPQILKGILHFGDSGEDYLKLGCVSGCVFWSMSALGVSFYVLKYALTSLKGRKTPLKNKSIHREERSTHGSATLITRKELEALNQKQGIPIGVYLPKILETQDPLILKRKLQTLKQGKILRLKVDHSVVIAPSGAGKGVGIIIPTLLDYKGPVFVTDIKGENYEITHKAREEMGHKVVCLDPFRMTAAVFETWNVLEGLRADSPTVIEDAAAYAALLSPQGSEGSNARYFSEQAARLIQCLMLYVVCSDDIQDKERNLVTVFDLLMQPIADLKDVTLQSIASKKDLLDGILARLAARILGTETRELSGTLNTAAQELSMFQSPLMRTFFEASTFKGAQVLDGKTDVYVCLPPEHRESYGRFMRLMTGCIFLEMQRAHSKKEMGGAKFQNNKLLMVLDEMPSLGHMPAIEDMIVYGRGYGVSVMAVSQTIELIKSTYPKTWRTFLSNHLALFFGSSDLETCQMVSEMLGKKTTLGGSYSEGRGDQKKSLEWHGSHSLQQGSSYGEVARPLLTPDEVKTLGEEVVIGFLRGTRPFMVSRLNYRTSKEFKNRFLENPFYK